MYNTSNSVHTTCGNNELDYAQHLIDSAYLEELLFQITDHQERFDQIKFKGLHKKLDSTVRQILADIRMCYDAIKVTNQ